MRVEKIAAHEKRFFDTGNIYGVQYSLSDHEYMGLKYTKCIPSVKGAEYYYDEQIKKEKIVTHFTEGYLKGDLGAKGGNTVQSKLSIGIELSNIGPLIRDGDVLNTLYGDVYCDITDHWAYHKFDQAFRGYYYFATYTEEQDKSLVSLLRYLTERYSIPTTFFEPAFEANDDIVGFEGICTHINFRDDKKDNGSYKKVDIGPGFQWEKIKRELSNG